MMIKTLNRGSSLHYRDLAGDPDFPPTMDFPLLIWLNRAQDHFI